MIKVDMGTADDQALYVERLHDGGAQLRFNPPLSSALRHASSGEAGFIWFLRPEILEQFRAALNAIGDEK